MLTLVYSRPNPEKPWRKVMGVGRRALDRADARCSWTRQLAALSRLDDRLLADIGLTREQQSWAYSKLLWRHL